MNDRELLEFAAKAFGYTNLRFSPKFLLADEKSIDVIIIRDDSLTFSWNPLNNDSDAFLLSVTLNIQVRQLMGAVIATYPNKDENFNLSAELIEPVLDDYYTATRRAIVRAAAEIGRHMQ